MFICICMKCLSCSIWTSVMINSLHLMWLVSCWGNQGSCLLLFLWMYLGGNRHVCSCVCSCVILSSINLTMTVPGDRCCREGVCWRETRNDLCGTSGHRCRILRFPLRRGKPEGMMIPWIGSVWNLQCRTLNDLCQLNSPCDFCMSCSIMLFTDVTKHHNFQE